MLHLRARIALHVVMLAVTVAVLFPVPPASAGPWTPAKGEWFSSFEGSVFSANTTYDSSGARRLGNFSAEERALRSYTELGWKKHSSIVLGVPAISVTRRYASPSIEGTATGLQDFLFGLRYNLANGSSALTAGLDWTAPLGYNRSLDSLGIRLGDGLTSHVPVELNLGSVSGAPRFRRDTLEMSNDGLQQLAAGLQVGTALFGRGFLQASIGYASRFYTIGARTKNAEDLYGLEVDTTVVVVGGSSSGGDTTLVSRRVASFHPGKGLWADQMVMSADLGFWVGRSLLVGGRYRGLTTVSHGPLVPEISQHLAGAVLLYRLDDGLDMYAGSWSTASGKNVLHFDQVYVGIAFHNTKLNRLQGFTGSTRAP